MNERYFLEGVLLKQPNEALPKNTLSTEQFIAKSKAKFGNTMDYTNTHYTGKYNLLTIGCSTHGKVVMDASQHLRTKHGCTKCDYERRKRARWEIVLKKAKDVHGNKYDYSRVIFTNMNDKVEIICPLHGSFFTDLYSHTARETNCPKCAIENGRHTTESFVKKALAIHGDLYDYSKSIYTTGDAIITIICKKHGEFTQRAMSHLAGCVCRKCFIEKCKLSVSDFIKNARSVHGDLYDYSNVVYSGNKTPVEIICPLHGSFWQKPNTHVSSRNGCGRCNESRGEKAVLEVLDKYGFSYMREYRIKPYLYRYDFYLPELNVFIEFHGHQHYRPVTVFGGTEEFRKTQIRDAEKEQLVADVNGKLIVLAYFDLINHSVEAALVRKLMLVSEEAHFLIESF